MNHKSVLAILVGAVMNIVGILNFFLRSPEIRNNNVARAGLVFFIGFGCAIMLIVIFYHQQTQERFFLTGVSTMFLTISVAMLGFFLYWDKWRWGILPLTLAAFFSGLFLTAHGVAKSRPIKLILLDDFVPYCPKCQVIFPLASKGDSCKNGCMP